MIDRKKKRELQNKKQKKRRELQSIQSLSNPLKRISLLPQMLLFLSVEVC